MSSVDRALERLFEAPLTGFVAERKAIARELRAAGDRDAARAVEATQRPSLAAWTLNQLARRHPRALESFLACIDRQLDGSVDARDDEKRALAKLLEHARELLESDGHAANRTNLERVTRALRSAAVDAGAREALEGGRLAEEPAQGDALNVLAALAPGAPPPKPHPPKPAPPKQEPAQPAPPKKKGDNAFARSARAHASRSPARTEQAERRAALERELVELQAERRALSARLERIDDQIATIEERLAEDVT